jgi:hypothetical protein
MQEADGRFGEGPFQMHVADPGAGGAEAVAGRAFLGLDRTLSFAAS